MLKKTVGYISPETNLIDILPMSVLCQSGDNGSSFELSLEDMTETDYTFNF